MRGIAILLVLVVHLGVWGESTADRVSRDVIGFGTSGVDLFFVLSGFLITRLLWASRGPGGLTRFWVRRILRIWPLYLGLLAALFLVLPALRGPNSYPMPQLWADRWFYWLHATNIKAVVDHQRGLPYNTGHLWSLAVEEQFYLVWPLIVWRIRSLKGLLRLSIATILVAWALRVVIGGFLGDELAAYMLTPARMDGFAFGAAIFALQAEGRLDRFRRPAIVALCVSFAIAISPFNTTAWEIVVIRLATSICHASLMTVVLTGSARLIDRAWLRMLGKYSYGIYMIHFPLILVLAPFTLWARRLPTIAGWSLPSAAANVAGVTLVTLVLAIASYHLLEERFLRLKDKLFSGPRPRPTAPAWADRLLEHPFGRSPSDGPSGAFPVVDRP